MSDYTDPLPSQTTATNGPWRVGDAGHTIFGPPNGNPAPEMVAQRVKPGNAKLIAKAPEMFAALTAIASGTCDHGPGLCARDIARNAIANLCA